MGRLLKSRKAQTLLIFHSKARHLTPAPLKNRRPNQVDPCSLYSAFVTTTDFKRSRLLAKRAPPSQVCLIGSVAQAMRTGKEDGASLRSSEVL